MGIDRIHQQAQKLERAGSDALAKQDYQTAANDFRKAAEKLRDAGDYDKSSFDFQRAGDALEGDGGIKGKAGDMKGAKTAFEGAATNLEDAGADALKTRSSTRHSTAEGYYGAAGIDRVHAGVYAQETHKKEEAAKNYRQGQADLQRAGDEATKQGRNDTALDYYDKAEKAGKAADEMSGKPKSKH